MGTSSFKAILFLCRGKEKGIAKNVKLINGKAGKFVHPTVTVSEENGIFGEVVRCNMIASEDIKVLL